MTGRIRRYLGAMLAALIALAPFAGYVLSGALPMLFARTQGELTVRCAPPDEQCVSLRIEWLQNGVPMDPAQVLHLAGEPQDWYAQDGAVCTDTPDALLTLPASLPNGWVLCLRDRYDHAVAELAFNDRTAHIDTRSLRIEPGDVLFDTNALLPAVPALPAWVYGALGALWLLLSIVFGVLRLPLSRLVTAVNILLLVGCGVVLGQFGTAYAVLLGCYALCAAALIAMQAAGRLECLAKYDRPATAAALWLLTLYTAFATYGSGLFFTYDVHTVSLRTLSCFGMLTLATAPAVWALVAAMELCIRRVRTASRPTPNARGLRRIRLVCFALTLAVLLIISTGFYPANMTLDGRDYWAQALGQAPLTEPYGYIVTLRAMAALTHSPYLYTVVQCALFAGALAAILGFLCQKGMRPVAAVVIALLVPLLPPVYMMLTLLSTNPWTGVLCLWGLWLLLRLHDDPHAALHSPAWLIGCAACFAYSCYMRRNTPVIIAGLCVALIGLMIANRKRGVARRITAVMLACVVLFGAAGAGLDRLSQGKESKNALSFSVFLFKPVAAAYANDCVLPQETLDVMKRALPLSYCVSAYDAHNSDAITFHQKSTLTNVTLGEYLRIFLDTFKRYPQVVLKDLLDQSELVWSVTQCRRGYNWRYQDGGYDLAYGPQPDAYALYENGAPYTDNAMHDALLSLAQASRGGTDFVLWRCGLYIILLAAVAIVLWGNHARSLLWCMMPVLALAAGTFPMIRFQIYQYIWFFPVCVAAFIPCALYTVARPQA